MGETGAGPGARGNEIMTQGKDPAAEACHEQRLRIAKFFVWAYEELTRGKEKESVGIFAGADGRPALPVRRGDKELSPPGPDPS